MHLAAEVVPSQPRPQSTTGDLTLQSSTMASASPSPTAAKAASGLPPAETFKTRAEMEAFHERAIQDIEKKEAELQAKLEKLEGEKSTLNNVYEALKAKENNRKKSMSA